jgi:hypothetical protein
MKKGVAQRSGVSGPEVMKITIRPGRAGGRDGDMGQSILL